MAELCTFFFIVIFIGSLLLHLAFGFDAEQGISIVSSMLIGFMILGAIVNSRLQGKSREKSDD